MNPCPPFQDLKTLAGNTCIGESTIERMVAEGRFPPPRRKLLGKRIWVWKEVEAFLSKPDDDAADKPTTGGILENTVRLLRNG